jgi:tetratricopeptide (TPR) repeat protein
VAALHRQGYLFERFARALHEVPVPPEFERPGQEQYLAEYQAQLASLAEPYQAKAIEAYTQATRVAQEFLVQSEWSGRAATALARLSPGKVAPPPAANGRFLPESPPRPDDAEQAARKVLGNDRDDVPALVALAIASLAQKRIELARAVLASAHRIAPGDPAVWNALGLVDIALGARVRAQARWKKALDLNPEHADAQVNLGQLMIEAGEYQGAVVALERAVRIAPVSAAAWIDLGIAYRGLARLEDARLADQRALELGAGKVPVTGGAP